MYWSTQTGNVLHLWASLYTPWGELNCWQAVYKHYYEVKAAGPHWVFKISVGLLLNGKSVAQLKSSTTEQLKLIVFKCTLNI